MHKILGAALLLAVAAIIGFATEVRQWGGGDGYRIAATAVAADLAPKAVVHRPPNARSDLGAQWLDENGRYRFPANDGFAAPPQDVTLAPGTMIDRYGQPGGRFLSPMGTPYDARALPYDRSKMDYYRYQVLKPLPVKTGVAAPWFDQPGGGVQYKTEKPVLQLIAEGYLREVKEK